MVPIEKLTKGEISFFIGSVSKQSSFTFTREKTFRVRTKRLVWHLYVWLTALSFSIGTIPRSGNEAKPSTDASFAESTLLKAKSFILVVIK